MSKPQLSLVEAHDPSLSEAWWSLWESFERHLRAKKPNENTLRTYRRGAACLVAFLETEGRSTNPATMTRTDVRDWLGWLLANRSPATADVYLAAIRAFTRWLVDEDEIQANPCQGVAAPTVPEQPAEIITEADMVKLLGACSGRDLASRRDAAMFRVAYDAGLRRGELVGLRVEDVDLTEGIVRFTGKGGRQEHAFLGARTVAALDRYMRVRKVHPKASVPALWLTPMGAMHAGSFMRILEKRAVMAGITRHLHPHAFRHGFANALKSAGASDEDVQKLGRWRDPRVMMRYGRAMADQRARETHRKLSPGDRV